MTKWASAWRPGCASGSPQHVFWLFIVASTLSVCAARSVWTPSPPVAINNEKQVMLDDSLVDRSQNMELVMNPPRKEGLALVNEYLWENSTICAYSAVVTIDGEHRLYYDAISTSRPLGVCRWMCVATSKDGITWSKPLMPLVPFGNITHTNIVWPRTVRESHGHEPNFIFVDEKPGIPESERVKGLARYNGPNGHGVYVLASADGYDFRLLSDTSIYGPSDTGNIVYWNQRLGTYVAYIRDNTWPGTYSSPPIASDASSPGNKYEGWPEIRSVKRATTDDLRKPLGNFEIVTTFDSHDPPSFDLYTSAATPYHGNMLFFQATYQHKPGWNLGTMDARLAVSRDGVMFDTRDHLRLPYVPLGPSNTTDAGTIYMFPGFIETDTELFQYYFGCKYLHGGEGHLGRVGMRGDVEGVLRVVQRLDGFVSYDTSSYSSLGEFTTKPVTFTYGRHLDINAEVAVGGYIRVQILAHDGSVIPGFRDDECTPIQGVEVHNIVSWNNGISDLSVLSNKVVRIRFVARNAKIYSFRIVP